MSAQPHSFTHKGDEVLILRRCGKDRVSRNGFIYPQGVGQVVTAPDFDTSKDCGGGLHGWPWGFGLGDGMDYDLDDVWLILGAKPEDVVGELGGGQKCKCRTATIRYDGDFAGAMAIIREGFHACIIGMAKMPPAKKDSAATVSDARRARLAASGDYSRLAASGDYSQLAASGDHSQLAASGDHSRLAASGDYSQLAASGHSSQLAASGHSSQLAASGDYSQLAASGHYSQLAASGHYSQLAASGDHSRLAASGDHSRLAASGDYSQLAASGDYSQLAASGDYSRLAIKKNSVAMCAGPSSKVKAGENGVFALSYWTGEETGFEIIVGKVGRDGIKADTWYTVKDGKLVEVSE